MQEMSLTSFWIIAGSCVLVLGIMILKNRARFALNFLVRRLSLMVCVVQHAPPVNTANEHTTTTD